MARSTSGLQERQHTGAGANLEHTTPAGGRRFCHELDVVVTRGWEYAVARVYAPFERRDEHAVLLPLPGAEHPQKLAIRNHHRLCGRRPPGGGARLGNVGPMRKVLRCVVGAELDHQPREQLVLFVTGDALAMKELRGFDGLTVPAVGRQPMTPLDASPDRRVELMQTPCVAAVPELNSCAHRT